MNRLIRYFFVGCAGALLDFVLFAALVKLFGLAWYYANVVSFTLATLVHYMLSIRFVFESGARFAKQHEIALVFLVSGMGLALNQAALYGLIILAGLNVLVSKVGATGAVFFWNFIARQRFIFRKASTVQQVDPSLEATPSRNPL
jgi:putative flippase GtrA